MRIFSYRNKQRLKRAGLIVLCAAVLLAVVCIAYVIYLGRYMVYTSDGAHLELPGSEAAADTNSAPDLNDDAIPVSGELVIGETVSPPDELTEQPADETTEQSGLPVLTGGYYADNAALMQADDVRSALETILSARGDDDGTIAVLLDLKSEYGNFYYSSGVTGASMASVDIAAIDELIAWLAVQPDVYLIARLPAFRDSAYALADTSRGLAISSGALWADGSGCYWLDPGNSDVLDHLTAICTELSGLGVDEVVFANFYFPDAQSIVYAEDQTQTLRTAAEWVASRAPIPVSFSFADGVTSYAAASYGLHICLEADDGASIAAALEPVEEALTGDGQQVLFLSASRDTRFDEYVQLRPVLEQ